MNWVLFLLVFGLSLFGIYAIYSATWMRNENFWRLQIIWLTVGTVVYFVVSMIDYRWIRYGAIPIYVLGILGLLAVKVFGVIRYNARSWIDLGVMSIQPSQLAILGGVMLLAVFLERFRHWPAALRILCCGVIVGIPCVLILKEPDLGSCIVWMPVLLAMMFAGDVPKRWMLALLILGIAFIPLVMNFGLTPRQYARITTFLNPDLEPLGDGWNINQSLIAIGSGGFSGKGFKAPNTQNELGFLPSTIVHNDFIFSVLGEQHGFVGGSLLILAFALLFVVALSIGMQAGDMLGRLLVVGFVFQIFAHTFMNIGMTISVTPITGLPLPFVSYGGTFLLTTLFSMGIVQSVWVYRKNLAR